MFRGPRRETHAWTTPLQVQEIRTLSVCGSTEPQRYRSDRPVSIAIPVRPGVTGHVGDHAPRAAKQAALIHEGLDPDSKFARNVQDGWAQIMSAMKTYLETQRVPV